MVGGTAAQLSGGKFANGAVTAAFARAFNDEQHLSYEHEYEFSRDICSTEYMGCTIVDALIIANPDSAPGTGEIQQGENMLRSLIPFRDPNNPIYHDINYESGTITNVALPGHVFQGRVTTQFSIVDPAW